MSWGSGWLSSSKSEQPPGFGVAEKGETKNDEVTIVTMKMLREFNAAFRAELEREMQAEVKRFREEIRAEMAAQMPTMLSDVQALGERQFALTKQQMYARAEIDKLVKSVSDLTANTSKAATSDTGLSDNSQVRSASYSKLYDNQKPASLSKYEDVKLEPTSPTRSAEVKPASSRFQAIAEELKVTRDANIKPPVLSEVEAEDGDATIAPKPSFRAGVMSSLSLRSKSPLSRDPSPKLSKTPQSEAEPEAEASLTNRAASTMPASPSTDSLLGRRRPSPLDRKRVYPPSIKQPASIKQTASIKQSQGPVDTKGLRVTLQKESYDENLGLVVDGKGMITNVTYGLPANRVKVQVGMVIALINGEAWREREYQERLKQIENEEVLTLKLR